MVRKVFGFGLSVFEKTGQRFKLKTGNLKPKT